MAALSTTTGPSVFLFGGGGAAGWLGDAWTFAGSWTLLGATGPSPRGGQAVASLGTQVVLFGGYDTTTSASLDDTWTFDGSTWTELAVAGPSARTGHAMATFQGRVVLFGGTDGGAPLDDTWTFDGTAWAQVVGAGPPARSGHAMATLP
jgi:N-acetylneuraminic acid mutarotase